MAYLIGMIVVAQVLRYRRGVRGGGRIKIVGRDGFGAIWFIKAMVLTAFWPLTVVAWLVRRLVRRPAAGEA
ncbi:hypothetical protein [Amycolatopsis magusensis]|uniref:Uncharacterized protein n=1 Tax=Amycolatopsis magusensis TaxID=882444 RepID=A0ABS4Q1I8_9PSEU|nr:hypothetical protein [Amycolatopsis magusensis]MBP2185545.1 hypothetical protein [Amycolatopsis magusensis]MDI5979252.1 hypothetical protein [Amycolatopsis magusensis]